MSSTTVVRRAAASLVLAFGLTGASCASPPPVGPFADRTHGVESIENLTYGEAIDEHGELETLQLDMFRPTGYDSPRPAIVFVHSGAFTGGYRQEQSAMAEEFAERGYLTVTITYRLREGTWIWFDSPSDVVTSAARDARHDAQAAVRWLRVNAEQYGVDAGRIGIAGYSAGGITALGVGQHPEDPGESGNPGPSSKVCVVVAISAIAVEGDIEADDAPVLMFHGSTDFIIPPSYARQTAWNAAVNHKLVNYVEFPEIGHTVPQQRGRELEPTMVSALRTHLVESPPCV